MKNQFLLAVSAIAVLTAAAVAEEQKVEKKLTCTTTVDGGASKTICTSDDGKMKIEKNITCKTIVNGTDTKTACVPGEGPAWEEKDGAHVMIVPRGGHGQGDGDDVDVQVFNDGKTEKRVMIVRTHNMDSADANKDGKVSRKEFLARAEKHFAEMDKNGNGSLEGDEMRPPMPPMPPMAPMPPVPPVPPVPPAPPAQN